MDIKKIIRTFLNVSFIHNYSYNRKITLLTTLFTNIGMPISVARCLRRNREIKDEKYKGSVS